LEQETAAQSFYQTYYMMIVQHVLSVVTDTSHTAGAYLTWLLVPSFSSKRGHVGEKHVLIGRKHDKLGNQTSEFQQPLSKLSHQSWKPFEFVDMFSIHKYCRNFKPAIPLFMDFRNEVIQMAAMRQISEICERYRINRSF